MTGSHPAKLKALKDAIPSSRRVTKTDLAKYINAWDKKPDFVSLGSQKNSDRFMASVTGQQGDEIHLPAVAEYKIMIAKAQLFRDTQKLVRPLFQAFQANVAAYVVSVVADKLGIESTSIGYGPGKLFHLNSCPKSCPSMAPAL